MDIVCPATGTPQKTQVPEFKPHVWCIYPALTPLFYLASLTEGAHRAITSPSTTGRRQASGRDRSRGRREGHRRSRATSGVAPGQGRQPFPEGRQDRPGVPRQDGPAPGPERTGAGTAPCPPPTGSERSWGGDAPPAPHASNTGHCPPRPAARSHPGGGGGGAAELGPTYQPDSESTARARSAMAPPPPLARSTRGRRALRRPPALARTGRRDAGPARSPAPRASPGARAGQGEGGKGGGRERREGRGGGGAGRDEQSPRPAAAWKLLPPWWGREGVRAGLASGLPLCSVEGGFV